MNIAFSETEPAEEIFFEKELGDHRIEFCDDVADCAPDTEAVSTFINSKIDSDFLEQHPALKLIATRSTTHDHIQLDACAQRGVTVCCVGSYGDNTVPEHVFALMLAICRKLRLAMEMAGGRRFSYEDLRGYELHGKTLGVIGTGRIGRQVLRLAKAFGMETIGFDSNPDPAAAEELGFRYVAFPRLLGMADFISINVPLNPATYHLFDRDTFAQCKPGMVLINTARGAIINSEALIDALNAGVVMGAGLDVLEDERVMRKRAANILTEQILERLHESFAPLEPMDNDPVRISEVRKLMHNSTLMNHPNVVGTPHIAFNSHEALERINRCTVENITAYLAGAARNVVNNGNPTPKTPVPKKKRAARA
jgi:D-lactate dehydrogenase